MKAKPASTDLFSSLSRPARDLRAKFIAEFDISDVAALTLLGVAVSAWDRARTAEQRLAVEGLTVRTRLGVLKPHPAVAIIRDAEATYCRCLRALNLDTVPKKKPGRPAFLPAATPLQKLGTAYVHE